MAFQDPRHDHMQCTADLLARAERTCARRGAKFTGPRREVLACVAESHQAAGAYEIVDRLASQGPRPAPITVYRALEFLEAHGLVHRIESRNAYVACTHAHEGRPSALLVCETCGAVAEAEAADTFAGLARKASDLGFETRQTIVEISGRCGHCAGGGTRIA